METGGVINMHDDNGNGSGRQSPGSSSSLVEHGLRPKGHAVPGIDYGLDLLKDDETNKGDKSGADAPNQGQDPSQAQAQAQVQAQAQSQSSYGQGQSHGYGGESSYGQTQVQGQSQSQSQSYGQDQGQSVGFQMPGFSSMDMQSMSSQGLGQEHGQGNAGAGFVGNDLLSQMQSQDQGQGLGYGQAPEPLSYEETRKRKTDALANLARLESQGYVPAGKKGSHTTDLAELESMVDKLTAQRDLDNSIKFQRKILVGFATLVETVCENDDYNIFDMDLEGWSESLFENISEYDEVFEELYLKYGSVAEIPPELKLVTMVAGSAWMYHLSRSMFGKASSKVPGFDEVMKFNPELKKHYKQSATELARQRGMPVPDRKKDKNNMSFIGQMLGVNGPRDMSSPPTMPQQHQPPRQSQPQHQHQHQHQPRNDRSNRNGRDARPPRKTRTRVPMEEPQDVDGLLSGLVGQDQGQDQYEEDEIDLSELHNMSDLDDL